MVMVPAGRSPPPQPKKHTHTHTHKNASTSLRWSGMFSFMLAVQLLSWGMVIAASMRYTLSTSMEASSVERIASVAVGCRRVCVFLEAAEDERRENLRWVCGSCRFPFFPGKVGWRRTYLGRTAKADRNFGIRISSNSREIHLRPAASHSFCSFHPPGRAHWSARGFGKANEVIGLSMDNLWRSTQLFYISAPLLLYSIIKGRGRVWLTPKVKGRT